jgi:plastocyanin
VGTGTLGAATVRGHVSLKEKGGRPSSDLSSVVVYIDGASAAAGPRRATMTMKGKAFDPRVLVVPVGGTVDFPNADPILHNVFSVTKGNPFDLSLYKAPKSASWTFRSPGVVNVYCNIHPQMSAVILVRDNPYFTMAAADGSFAIDGVPAGRYTVRAWHDRAGEASQSVVVGAAEGGDVALDLDASRYKWIPHRNKFGRPYAPAETY